MPNQPRKKSPIRWAPCGSRVRCSPRTRDHVATLSATNADVIRYPNGPVAYSLVGRLIGSMPGLSTCIAMITSRKYVVARIATFPSVVVDGRFVMLQPPGGNL